MVIITLENSVDGALIVDYKAFDERVTITSLVIVARQSNITKHSAVYNFKAGLNSSLGFILPNEREPFFLRDVVDSDLFKVHVLDAFARLEEVYLEADFDLLGEGSLREHRLHLGDHGAGDHAT